MANQFKWSWLGFFFGPFYYIGYGKLKKGWILFVFYCLSSLITGIYCGIKAKHELPIGEVKFNWKLASLAILLYVLYFCLTLMYAEHLKQITESVTS